VGVKFQIPLAQSYSTNGLLRVWAYYPRYDTYFHGDTPLPGVGNLHGFGQGDTSFAGENNGLQFGISATGEIGLLFSLSRRVDLSISGDYWSFGRVFQKKNVVENDALIMPDNTDPFALDKAEKVGDGLKYQGFFNSFVTDNIYLLSLGAKISLRIKLTKLEKKEDATTINP
jgi:hypothetical protein